VLNTECSSYKVFDAIEVDEKIIFINFIKIYAGEETFELERIRELENNFNIYIKSMRELYKKCGDRFNMTVLYDHLTYNHWAIIRRALCEVKELSNPLLFSVH